jgi:hypothetical protein
MNWLPATSAASVDIFKLSGDSLQRLPDGVQR